MFYRELGKLKWMVGPKERKAIPQKTMLTVILIQSPLAGFQILKLIYRASVKGLIMGIELY